MVSHEAIRRKGSRSVKPLKLERKPTRRSPQKGEAPKQGRKTFWKSKKKMYWAAAYGGDFRWIEAPSVIDAAKNAFGKIDRHFMSIKPAPQNPKKMTKTERDKFLQEFAEQHKKRTGFTLQVSA